MLALGVAPGASQLRPVQFGRDLQELLVHDHAFEKELINLYDRPHGIVHERAITTIACFSKRCSMKNGRMRKSWCNGRMNLGRR